MIPNTVIWQYPTFANTPISNITLHVPTASIDAYKTTKPWNDFKEIVALTDGAPKPTGIKTVELQELNENNIYDLTGHRLVATKKGLNIIRMSNGKTQKVVVK